MNRHDVKLLQAVKSYPSISILAPTHRTSPENRQDPVRVKNLVNEAIERLRKEYNARETQQLETRLAKLVDGIDWRHTLDGLAIYLNEDLARVFDLPFTVRERVVIDETFATRDLVYSLNRSPRYWVLVLSEKPTRLYEGHLDRLEEVVDHGFPMVHEGPGGAAPLPAGIGVNKSSVRDAHHREFFRNVDRAFAAIHAADPLPVILCGVDRYHAFFREVSSHTRHIVGDIQGSYDAAQKSELAERAWPVMVAHLDRVRAAAIDELDRAVGAQRFASTLDDVWRAAAESRVAKLVLEEGYHTLAVVDGEERLQVVDDPTTPGVIDDAIDEIVEMVLRAGGDVQFVGDGQITEQHQRIAAILRY